MYVISIIIPYKTAPQLRFLRHCKQARTIIYKSLGGSISSSHLSYLRSWDKGEIFNAGLGDQHIILDADATKIAEAVQIFLHQKLAKAGIRVRLVKQLREQKKS
uniref:Uncharacterized protein n=1 Tax=Anopheles maculatus TaxID=74869 RepID=A0A182T9Y6_9DIPT